MLLTISNTGLPAVSITDNITIATDNTTPLGTAANVAALKKNIQTQSFMTQLSAVTATITAKLADPATTFAQTNTWFAPDWRSGWAAAGTTTPLDAATFNTTRGAKIFQTDPVPMTAAELAKTNLTTPPAQGYWLTTWSIDSNGYPDTPTKEALVSDGAGGWKMWGDRHPVEAVVSFQAMYDGTNFMTSIITFFNDNFGTAFASGIRSVVMSGPGLPATGYVLGFDGVNPTAKSTANQTGPLLTDAQVSAMPANPLYTVKYCVETMAVLTAQPNAFAACTQTGITDPTVQASYTMVTSGKPRLMANMTAADFPALVTPAPPLAAPLVTPGGNLSVSWTQPANQITASARLNFTDTAGQLIAAEALVRGPAMNATIPLATVINADVNGMLTIETRDKTTLLNYARFYNY